MLPACLPALLQMNRESSRSHLIMTICIEATNLQTQSVSRGKLSFVDLAGSERWVFAWLACLPCRTCFAVGMGWLLVVLLWALLLSCNWRSVCCPSG
jgi:hypothetical protein